jgi:hypothetical protein
LFEDAPIFQKADHEELMIDTFHFQYIFGVLEQAANFTFLERSMINHLMSKNQRLNQKAEELFNKTTSFY